MNLFGGCVAALLLGAAPAAAQTLWQNVEYGMTAEQVRRAQPRSAPSADPQRLFNGATCSLRIENYEVGPHRLEVCFYMLEGRLHQVTLKMREATEATFDSLTELLRARYGRELEAGSTLCNREDLPSCTANWFLPSGVNINLGWYSLGAGRGFLNLNYQTRFRDESSRL